MIVLFCKGRNIGSKLIASIDGGPYSHVAIMTSDCRLVAHSTHSGVTLTNLKKFKAKYDILEEYEVPTKESEEKYFIDLIAEYIDTPYDWLGLIYLGLIKLGLKSKENIWQNRNYFICTEFVTRAIIGETNSLMGLTDLEKYINEEYEQ